MDTNALALIGKLLGYNSEEYELSKYYITGAETSFLESKQSSGCAIHAVWEPKSA